MMGEPPSSPGVMATLTSWSPVVTEPMVGAAAVVFDTVNVRVPTAEPRSFVLVMVIS